MLLSAYACEPGRGSEPGVGWNWAIQAARFAEVWVITRANNREVIEKALPNLPCGDRIHFVYVDLPYCLRFWKRGERGIHLYYTMWQLYVGLTALKLHRRIGFDVAQHVTFANAWMPSYLWILKIPFIFGPVGTNLLIPRRFTKLFTFKERLENCVRRVLVWCSLRFRPDLLITTSKADVILCNSGGVRDIFPARLRKKTQICWQNGVESRGRGSVETDCQAMTSTGRFRVLSVGRLVYHKGYELALRGFAASNLGEGAEYIIIGEGPWQQRLEALASELGVEGRIRFLGKLSQDEVFEEMRKSDVFLFPTFESAGMVVMEAMSCGLPSVSLDWGGPQEYLCEDSGIRIAFGEPEQVVRDLGRALRKLVEDEDYRYRLSEGALERCRSRFEWRHRGNFLAGIVDELVTDGAKSDSF